MLKKSLLVLLGLGTLFGTTISAQTCGDYNNDGTNNIGDLLNYLDWITGYPSPPPFPWTADVDNIQGKTIADIVRLSDYFFNFPTPTLDCSPNDTYDYAISNTDTIFLPAAFADPSIADEVELPIVTSFSDSVIGMYLAVLNDGFGSTGHYEVASTWSRSSTATPINHTHYFADSSFFASSRIYTGIVSGENTFFSITFDSTGVPGEGYIAVDKIDRSSEWRSCIVKENGQLYIPVFATLTHTYNQLEMNDGTITIRLALGVDSSAVPTVRDITSNHEMISWEAQADANWVVLNKTSGQTPDQIEISVDKTGLNFGWHYGYVTIRNSDYPRTFPRTIQVSLHIGAVDYEGIDANCDGNFNVSDIVYLTKYLFGDPIGPAPCEPCSAAAENYPPMDLNCDGKTNITDVVRAMRYLYEVPFGAIPCDRCTE